MPIQFTEKWDQYGLMAELALKLKGVSPQFGKTVLQIFGTGILNRNFTQKRRRR